AGDGDRRLMGAFGIRRIRTHLKEGEAVIKASLSKEDEVVHRVGRELGPEPDGDDASTGRNVRAVAGTGGDHVGWRRTEVSRRVDHGRVTGRSGADDGRLDRRETRSPRRRRSG